MANIGNVYTRDGQEFTGSTFSEHLYLLAPYGERASNFALSAPFKITFNNVKISASSSRRVILELSANPSIGSFDIALESNGNINLWCNFNSYVDTTIITYSADNYYDFEVEYNGAGTITARAKLSSNSNWSSKTYSYTFSSGSVSKSTFVGTSYTEGAISNVLVTRNGSVLFSRDSVTPSVPIPKIGSSDISKIYLGTEEISKIYLGSELVYEASGGGVVPVFDLVTGAYDTSQGNWSDKDAFLRGENVSLTLYRQSSGNYAGIYLSCSDWTNVAEIRITGNGYWYDDSIYWYDADNQSHTISGTQSGYTITIPISSDIRNSITKLWAMIARTGNGTFSDFTVYDDNDNVIIPAS